MTQGDQIGATAMHTDLMAGKTAAIDLAGGSEGALQVTGGISEALVSTAAGLIVALLALFFTSLFRGFYRRQVSMIQEFGTQLEVLHLGRHEGFSSVPKVMSESL